MTDAELRDAGVTELEKTTDPYPTWVRKGKPSTSHWAKALAFFAQIGALPPLPPPTPTSSGLRLAYNANGGQAHTTDWAAIHAQGFNTYLCGADETPTLTVLKNTGCKAWVRPGYWTGSGFSTTDAQAVAMLKAAVATGVVVGAYIADEPAESPANIAAVKARSNLIKAACPGVETLIAYFDAPSIHQWKGAVDAFAADIYPARSNWNMQLIPQLAAACDTAGLRYYGIVGCDGAPNYPMPTPAQLQTMIDLWKATKQAGSGMYAWAAPGHVENDPALLAVLKAANES